jgi:hypothetical protein
MQAGREPIGVSQGGGTTTIRSQGPQSHAKVAFPLWKTGNHKSEDSSLPAEAAPRLTEPGLGPRRETGGPGAGMSRALELIRWGKTRPRGRLRARWSCATGSHHGPTRRGRGQPPSSQKAEPIVLPHCRETAKACGKGGEGKGRKSDPGLEAGRGREWRPRKRRAGEMCD